MRSTISFVLLLSALLANAQSFVRKPYLQLVGPNKVTIKFRLSNSLASTIKYGQKASLLDGSKSSSAPALDHEILLDNLQPNTTYFYTIQLDNQTILSDSTFFFKTAPTIGAKTKFSFWSIGDMYGGPQQTAVYEGFKKFRKGKYTNLFLTVGDNVYCGGNDGCYQSNFFDVYQNGAILQQAGFFPSTGNHDYDGYIRTVDNPDMAYYNNFVLPAKAELGGIPSNSEGYYSYDYGNAHFIVLETHATGKDGKRIFEADNIQLNWLKEDLQQNKQDWTIVYFHFPLYTKGSYDSDVNPDLIKLRETLAPIFDKYKVDLVLSGHSHTMERSKPTQGHYSLSNTFDPKLHQPQSSSGYYNGSKDSCPYFFNVQKPEKSGVIYVTNGASGATGRPTGFGTHPIMQFDRKDKIGSFFCEVEGNQLSAKFIDENGLVIDQFTVLKSKDGKCTNCFISQPNFGCGPSGKPKLLNNPLNDYCKNDLIEFQAIGDSTSFIKWHDPLGNIVKTNSNKYAFKLSKTGRQTVYLSQIVNGFESDSLSSSFFVHDTPQLENTINSPTEIFPFVNQLFSIKQNDSIKSYTWTLPAGWIGTSNTNSISIKPNTTSGELRVFGTSIYGCVSNEVKLALSTTIALGINETTKPLLVYPNPLIGNWATIEIPTEWLGKTGRWISTNGQILSSHQLFNPIQQVAVPSSNNQMIFYQVIDHEKVLGSFKVMGNR